MYVLNFLSGLIVIYLKLINILNLIDSLCYTYLILHQIINIYELRLFETLFHDDFKRVMC